ncbi:MAG: hypothetical protein R3C19_18855 [Planctomycetaceae bacterium]
MTVATLALMFAGCTSESKPKTETPPPIKSAEASSVPDVPTADDLRRQLRANERAAFRRVGNDFVEADLFQSGTKTIEPLAGLPLRALDLGACKAISDLTPLKGMPLKRLILEDTSVEDISPLAGMELELLFLQNTKVKDLSVLKGMPLKQLNLMNVPVSDLSVVEGMPLETLWIPGTQVTDASPLKNMRLVSLDLEDVQLSDFSIVAAMTSLKRLNISGTPLQDVSILKDLSLERISITPGKVTSGIDVLRNMPTLSQVWVSNGLESETQQFAAADFWKRYDEGAWTPGEQPESPTGESETESSPPDAADAPSQPDADGTEER